MRWRLAVTLTLFGSAIAPVRSLVLIGPDDNLAAPPNGAPWAYVARLDTRNSAGDYTASSSGVYLRNRFVLTAEHVSAPVRVSLAGTLYDMDPAYEPKQIGGVDLKLVRILTDPGLAPLSLIAPGDKHLRRAATIIGWGVGKGEEIAAKGWRWADDLSRVQRWGTNLTLSSLSNEEGRRSLLRTKFNRAGGPDEATATGGDSGAGLFQKFDETWKLAGIVVSVSGPNDRSLYDQDASAGGDQPHQTFYVPIKRYRDALLTATAATP